MTRLMGPFSALRLLSAVFCVLALSGCAGYQLGTGTAESSNVPVKVALQP